MTVKVTFATDRVVDGEEYKADKTAAFEPGVAAELLALGYARPADEDARVSSRKSAETKEN